MRRSLCTAFFFITEDTTISKEALINEEIRAKEVRLIDADGNQLGIVSIQEAMEKAHEAELDLVNISPNAAPPVCRIMDYGKYRYDQQKREKEAKKKQKTTEVKEMRLGIFTEEHDLDTKAKHVQEFLNEGDKVKVTIRFRGRELAHTDLGYDVLQEVLKRLTSAYVVEKAPAMDGKTMSMTISAKAK